ncbi:MAG: family ATPase [Thermodesulfobacteriota bacterium]|nr:family ATPase [Thermodesulfobacteriota bacterium]
MLIHPTLDKLKALRFTGMARALEEQMNMPQISDLTFEERLGLMIDREVTERENRRLNSRLKKARLRQQACIEDIDYRYPRGLDKSLMAQLATCTFISEHHNLIITGPTGCGKTYLSCALAQKACREGYSAQYIRLPRLLPELHIAKGDGRYGRLLASFAKTDLLVLDDWGLIPLNDEHRHDLLEITEDRYNLRSTVLVSQFPLENWHDLVGDPTLADAILDRLVHNAYKITLKGDSMRKRHLTQPQPLV